MGLLDALKQYINDAKPGGLLNQEWTPENIRSAGEVTSMLPNPVGDVASGLLAIDDVRQGNYGDAALNALGVLPFVPAMGGIVKPEIAKMLRTTKQLPDDDIFRAAVANTKGAEVTEDGLKMVLQRNQLPDQSMQPSVRGGVFYLPEGSSNSKYYTGTGYAQYGGTEKITGETLIKNPLFAKGATGGKAPESAYDSLLGKGAYQKVREDALQASGVSYLSRGITEQDKIDRVAQTLTKYGADPALAESIVKNSKKGNQLPYAIQEAIVAAAVRNAGHDAVLGYSKGKSGPFISEVFDVRESHYPDKFGWSKVWPSLLQ